MVFFPTYKLCSRADRNYPTPLTCTLQNLLSFIQVFEKPHHALALQERSPGLCNTSCLPLAPGDLSLFSIHRGPGVQVLSQRDVILAVITDMLIPTEEVVVRPYVTAE